MNLAKAIDLMIAAKEDPVLAAWTFMILEMETSPNPDSVSPYDAWDAYQKLYDLGLVTTDVFRRTDPEQTFFANSAKPAWGAVASVLYAYTSLKTNLKEPPMSKNRIANPFEQSEAIVTRETIAPTIPASRNNVQLPFAGAAPGGALSNPFSTTIRPIESPPSPFGNLGSPKAPMGKLPSNKGPINDMTVEPEMYCCGKRLEMANDGGQVIGPDDLPGNQGVSVIDAIFHGICSDCQRVWHTSVGQIIHDTRR